MKLNLHGTVVVSSAQLIEEIEEDAKKDGKSEDVTMGDAAAPAAAPAAAAASPTANGEAEKKEEKMDTSEAGTEAGKDVPPAAAVAKKKVKHADLKVESHPAGGLDGATLTAYFEKEAAMANQVRTHLTHTAGHAVGGCAGCSCDVSENADGRSVVA